MARKKKSLKKISPRKGSSRFRLPFSVPDGAVHLLWGAGFLLLGIIIAFAFFGNSGSAGAFLLSLLSLLTGKGAILLPALLGTGSLLLFAGGEENRSSILFALTLGVLGLAGSLGGVSFLRDAPEMLGGWIGYLLAWPLVTAFGFWVGEIILASALGVSLLLLWRSTPHPEEDDALMSQLTPEKIRKIFEPHFEVKEVDPEPKVTNAIVESESAKEESKEVKKKAKEKQAPSLPGDYKIPPVSLLESERTVPNAGDIKETSAVLKKTLQNFGIATEVSEVNIGPAVTQYALKPAEGIKLSRITALQNDLALALAAHPLRVEAPIPGRSLVGIEVPNKVRAVVRLRALLEDPLFARSPEPLLLGLGQDVSGNSVFADLARMPHMLVAGATGSGKTIGLNNIIMSLVFRNGPERLRLILVDPKRVEFPVYNDLPHLLTPVILENQRAVNALKWLIKEMERRFEVFSSVRVRDIKAYHALYEERKGSGELEQVPYIVAIIDELADLMASRGKEIEALVVRLVQMARAVGIHLVLATQRPSVEVITGLIKANVTSRIAFQVASQVDSRTILDMAGAEKLLGRGDMLFLSTEFSKPRRIQGALVGDKDVKQTVAWIAKENERAEREDIGDDLGRSVLESMERSEGALDDEDPLFEEARRLVTQSKKASASFLQRRLKVGYARAARLLDMLEEHGVVGPGEGAKPREVFEAAPVPPEEEDYSESFREEGEEEWRSP